MPKYLVTKKSWLNLADPADKSGSSPRLCKVGQIVRYDGPPGSSLELIEEDDAKKLAAANAAAAAANKSGTPTRAEMDELLARIAELEGKGKPKADEPVNGGPVEIPADWENLTPAKRLALARRLGAPMTMNAEGAREYIAAEVKRREPVKVAAPAAPPAAPAAAAAPTE